jgi:hypothetical protein
MKLYEGLNQGAQFGLEVSIDDTGFTYITRMAYETEQITQYWSAMRAGPTNIKIGAPPLDTIPLWTTEKYSIFEDPSAQETRVDFIKIKNSPDFSDHGLYVVYSPYTAVTLSGNAIQMNLALGADDENNDEGVEATLKPNTFGKGLTLKNAQMPYTNIYSLTTAHKMNPYDFLWHHNQAVSRMISICVPFADSDFSDWDLIFKMRDTGLLKIKSGQTTIPMPPKLGNVFLPSIYPKVWFKEKNATITSDGFIDIDFYLGDSSGAEITGHDADVYLDTTAGLLNKQRVTTKNGKGTVRLIANHLTSGDLIKVKCGFKYFTGTDDCVVTVQ